jgi:hypothetical protein
MRKVRINGRVLAWVGVTIAVVAPAVAWRSNTQRSGAEAALNYKLNFSKPDGWTERPHSPQSLFVYANPDGVTMKGGHMQVVDAQNPTPDMDRDALSNNFADITRENLGWKVTMGDVIECDGGSYRLLRRVGGDRTIVSAVSVRGNTTVLVTLSAIGKSQKHIDEAMPDFLGCLKASRFTLAHYD